MSKLNKTTISNVRRLLFTSLLAGILIAGTFITGMPSGTAPIQASVYVIDETVYTENEIRNAIGNATDGINYVIALGADIQLTTGTAVTTAPLQILANKNITLISAPALGRMARLVGRDGTSNNFHTIYVHNNATLTIDGIVVTHNNTRRAANGVGSGVFIANGGTLVLESGSISWNRRTYALLAAHSGGGVDIAIGGTFIMNGGEIAHNFASGRGGGVGVFGSGIFEMHGGEIYGNATDIRYDATGNFTIGAQNLTYGYGGGGVYSDGGFVMYGGEIYGNTSGQGGGILAFRLTIMGGSIYNNTAAYGGGICLYDGAGPVQFNFQISDCVIHGNTATIAGGGIFLCEEWGGATINLSNVSINCNSVTSSGGKGGGIYVDGSGNYYAQGGPINKLVVLDNTTICNNSAFAGSGGGIFTTSASYENLTISPDTIFLWNSSSHAYEPPLNADVVYPGIEYKYTSIAAHPLNNDDINYAGSTDAVNALVYYDANGGTGGVDRYTSIHDVGDTVTVLSGTDTGISEPGLDLVAWNTLDACCITSERFEPGDSVLIEKNFVLFAEYSSSPAILCTIVYHGNGATGGSMLIQVVAVGEYVKLNPNAFARTGYTFAGWSASINGSDVSYDNEHEFTAWVIEDDVVLYAKWDPKNIAITYYRNDGTAVVHITASGYYDTTLPAPAAPLWAGYAFNGWYFDSHCTVPWFFSSGNNGVPSTPGTPKALTSANGVVGADGASPSLALYAKWSQLFTITSTLTKTTTITVEAETTTTATRTVTSSTTVTPTTTTLSTTTSTNVTTTLPTSVITTTLPVPTTSTFGTTITMPIVTTTATSTQTATITTTLPAEPGDSDRSWALLNLILCALGVLLTLGGIIRLFFWSGKKETKGGVEEKKANFLWLILAVLLAIAGIIVFFLTEDISLPMGWVDMWTVVNAVIFLAGLVSLLLVFRKDMDEYRGYRS